MRPASSYLFVPGNRSDLLRKANSLEAEAFVLDLEDSVPCGAKDDARDAICDAGPNFDRRQVWVRINSAPEYRELDIPRFAGKPWLAGFVLPKVESQEQILEVRNLIAYCRSDPELKLRFIPSIESALSVLNAYDIARGPDVHAVGFGGAEGGDLVNDLGCTWSSSGPEVMHARQHALLRIRAARTIHPLDSVYSNVRDVSGFEQDTALSRRLGFRGRMVIHPNQIEPANRIYAPSAEEIEFAFKVVDAFRAALDRGQATTTVGGKLIDNAMYLGARQLIEEVAAQN